MKKILISLLFLLLVPITVTAKSLTVTANIEDEDEKKVIKKVEFVFRSDKQSEFTEENLLVYTLDDSIGYKYVDNNYNYNILSFVFARVYMGNTIDNYNVFNVIQNNENFIDADGNYIFDFTIKKNPNSHVKTSHVYNTKKSTTTIDIDSITKSTNSSSGNNNQSTSGSNSVNSTSNSSNGIDKTSNSTDDTSSTTDLVQKEREKRRKEQEKNKQAKKRFDFYLMVWVILAVVVLIFVLFTIVKALRANNLK